MNRGPAAKTAVTIFEFDTLTPHGCDGGDEQVPAGVYAWLEAECLRMAEAGETAWLKLVQRRGRRAIQLSSYVGVIRAPDGFQIEVLPKVGRAMAAGHNDARELLLKMLCCLNGFRHIQTGRAQLAARRMPLLEVFIGEFLLTVEHIVKRGLRSDYTTRQDNLFALRGKLQVAQHLRQNQFRADRFFTEHDEFTTNRPENRLLHAALRRTLAMATAQGNQRLARELCFVFTDIPESEHIAQEFQCIRLDRGMDYYADALAWARLILELESPLTGCGGHRAPSLLFPMAAVFEAYVAKHVQRQLQRPFVLHPQACSQYLVRHVEQSWFQLKPDLLVRKAGANVLVLDSKWKLLDGAKANGKDKYGLSQADFYQLHAYGQSYLDGRGDIVLIYPKTDQFSQPLPAFHFPNSNGLRLWVLPFCLEQAELLLPTDDVSMDCFRRGHIFTEMA